MADASKATRYLALLDNARANGEWNEVTELVRKVTKHAPERKFLIQLASIENELVRYATGVRTSQTPASSIPAPVFARAAELQTRLANAGAPNEEKIQAQACILWAHSLSREKGETPLVFFKNRSDLPQVQQGWSTWSKICLVKAVYFECIQLKHHGHPGKTSELTQAIIPWLETNRDSIIAIPQLSYWSQQILAEAALTSITVTGPDGVLLRNELSGRAFREWSVLALKSKDFTSLTYGNAMAHISKASVWHDYHHYLSQQLRPSQDVTVLPSTRQAQALELRRVESAYENELLRSSRFPTAKETNTHIEEWVESVMENWQILCGPPWRDADLGDGGRNLATRNVLDILYRAASKTFHSTLILRRLFQVHKSLAEFELAYQALDTYIELIERGVARAAKAKEPATGQDDHETVLRTISEGIEGLCTFGRQAEAEKAYELCLKLEIYAQQILDQTPQVAAPNGNVNGTTQKSLPQHVPLSSATLEMVYRAVGVCKAHWAKWTPFNEDRNRLQAEALSGLQKATEYADMERGPQQTFYALALLLAETREVDQAIAYVKDVLSWSIADEHDPGYADQRNLIQFWHLLVLLLTARQDFETSERSCVAALDQFSDLDTQLGERKASSMRAVEKEKRVSAGSVLLDEMETAEKQRFLELHITKLSLTELIHGPEEAVNHSDQILALYTRCFQHLDIGPDERTVAKPWEVSNTPTGTIKSVRGSIFGRRKRISSSPSYEQSLNGNTSTAAPSSRPATHTTQTTQAPTIHVTDHTSSQATSMPASADATSKRTSLSKIVHPHHGKEKRNSKHVSAASSQQSFETTHEMPISTAPTQPRPALETIKTAEELTISQKGHNASSEARQPLQAIPHNLNSHNQMPPPASHPNQPPLQDIRLPTSSSNPAPRFSKAVSQKHALTILVKIWLVIATLYRRASMFDDSKGACEEAANAAQKVEQLVANVESSARAFTDPGWGGGGKSSDDLWADVCCERAELQLAIAHKREDDDTILFDKSMREAVEHYEECLMFSPDHAHGVIGLSNLLLDYYEKKIELSLRIDDGRPKSDPEDVISKGRPKTDRNRVNRTSDSFISDHSMDTTAAGSEKDLKKTPENLNRLAARDRAYGLLSTLTKLGSGWDNAEAWYALARAHELGGEIDKAKEILWWCVELEDSRPIRHWRNLGTSGYVL